MTVLEKSLLETTKTLRVAVVHDWLFIRRGGEKVLEHILTLLPHADVYYLFGDPKAALQNKEHHRFFPSFLQRIPWVNRIYKWLLPILPMAIETFDLSRYDLVVSSSHCVAKGVITPPSAKHVCYLHSPMRYVWDQEYRYFSQAPSFRRPLEIARRLVLSFLRMWDVTSSQRCDTLVANSSFVKRRCELYYGKKTKIIEPPVDVTRYLAVERPSLPTKKVLLFGAWVPYKQMFEALRFLVKAGFSVIAAGSGEGFEKAQRHYASDSRVELVPNPTDADVAKLFARSDVLVFPAIEDFGIVVIEALAAGLIVVCPDAGATRETVDNNKTGKHFRAGDFDDMVRATRESLDSLDKFTAPEVRRQSMLRYSEARFREAFAQTLLETLDKKKSETL